MMGRAAIAAVAMCVLVAAARGGRADEPRGADDEATRASRVWFEAGRAAYRAGDFAASVQDFEKGYELKPLPLYLFNIGKAALKAGLKRKALQFFRQYVAREPDSAEADEARARVRELEGELGETPAPPPPPAPPPVVAEPAPSPAATIAAAAPPPRRSPARDPAGWILVGGGVAVAAAGAGVWGWANADANAANAAATLQAYDDRRSGVVARQIAGVLCVAAGGALVVGGIVRFAVVGRRR